MKHHIEGIRYKGYCAMTTYAKQQVDLWNQYGDPCGDLMCGDYDLARNECQNQEDEPCDHLILQKEHFAYDCSSYRYNENDGLTSRGRHYETGTLVLLKIDGAVVWGDGHD